MLGLHLVLATLHGSFQALASDRWPLGLYISDPWPLAYLFFIVHLRP